jgi:1-acyl-sn-glycerol-3-phosphate acyltransferase
MLGAMDEPSLQPGELDLARPPALARRLDLMLRFALVVLAAIPTTTVPPMALTALFYRRFRDEERFQRMHKVLGWADFCTRTILSMDVRVRGRERLPSDRSRLMFVSNHQSFVDIPLIMSALGIGAFLSKRSVAYLPFLGPIAWLAGTVYFDRSKPGSRKKALEDVLRMCEGSTPVVVFPEGTRSRNGDIGRDVHLGAVRACWERGLRVGTFAQHGSRYVCPPMMDRFHGRQRVAIVVGETFDPAGFRDGDEFARAVWDEVVRCFAEAREMRTDSAWPDLHRAPRR